jgi:diguanylate cyclase (GGDEF)-like protein/putative nucleotidyltransferase with HDIG domain
LIVLAWTDWRHSIDWIILIGMVTLATLAQLFKAEGPNHQAFFAASAFYFAATLLLPFPQVVLVITIPLLIEWAKARLWDRSDHLRHWYIQSFNIAMHLIAAFAAHWLYHSLMWGDLSVTLHVIIVLLAALVYLFVSQTLLGQAFVVARNLSWRESGVFANDNLISEFTLLCTGIVISELWRIDPWLIAPGLAPLVMMYRALLVPKLRKEAQTDSKTGLFNARYFKETFAKELERAQRLERPLAFIMADLDLLRMINNVYGHLAGDIVISGIGKIIQQNTREYDICGRFGGEEFAIVVPEAEYAQAMALAERIRQTIQETVFTVPNTNTQIRATMSFGVACFPHDASTMTDLMHKADVAVYQSKHQGRNRVTAASDITHAVECEYNATHNVSTSDGATVAVNEQHSVQIGQEMDKTLPDDAVIASSNPAADQAVSPDVSQSESEPARPQGRNVYLGLLVAGVIALGAAEIVLVIVTGTGMPLALPALLMLVILAAIAEFLQISVYDDNTMSVSLAPVAAGALIGGLPGAMIVSLSAVIADQIRRRRPLREAYKGAFNWGAHVIALTPIALAPSIAGISLSAAELPALTVLTLIGGVWAFAVDSMLISAAISLSKRTSLRETWHTQFRWLAPHYLALTFLGLFLALAYAAFGILGALVFVLPTFMLRYVQQQYVARTQESVRELRRVNAELTRANREIARANQAIQSLNDEMLEMMARILDARDPYTGGHAAKVADYASAIAQELGMPEERVNIVRQAALLHDIGKVAIADHILYKPSRLTEEEYEYVKQHVTIGADLLEQSQGLRHLTSFVRYHHERWDGKGYPSQLRGQDIPLEARILGICDAAEAMISDRPYRKAMPLDAVITELKRCAGTQFDPALVEIFIRIVNRERDTLFVNSGQEIARRGNQSQQMVERRNLPLDFIRAMRGETRTV